MSEFTHRLPHQPWSKPSRNEEEYFHREEFRRRTQAAREREAQRAAREQERLLALRRDHCPKCGARLDAIELEEVRADQCPDCLGVWLDHDTFDRLTHPHKANEYLAGILREVVLQYTTGAVKPSEG